MKISDGTTDIDLADSGTIILRSLNSLLSIKVLEDDPTYGDHILFSLNDERIRHDQLAGLNEDDHVQYLDQARHLALHNGDLGATPSITLDGLIDVQILNPQYPEVLKYNGSRWSNARITHHELSGLDDFDDHPQYLNISRHNLSRHSYYNSTTGTGNLPHDKLANLTDVDLTGMVNGQVLAKSGERFIPVTLPATAENHDHNLDYLRLDGSNAPTSNISMGGKRLKDVGIPVETTDAATKGMLDAIVWRKPVISIVNTYPTSPVNGNRYAISQNATDESIRGQIIEYQNGWIVTGAYFGNAFFNIQDKKPYYWNGLMFNSFGNTIPVEDLVMRNGTTELTGNWNTGDYIIQVPNATGLSDVTNVLSVKAIVSGITFQNPVIDIQLPNHDVGYPANPKVGDRYVASWGSVPGITPQAVLECYEVTAEGAKWLVTLRKKGMVVYSLYHDRYYWYDGNNWERFEYAFDIRDMNYGDLHLEHGSLAGLLDDDHLNYVPADGSRPLTGNMDAGGFRLSNLHDGTADTDAVTYQQLLLVASGISWLKPIDRFLNTPNASYPRVIVGTEPTGVFVGHTNDIATYADSVWTFETPADGNAVIDKQTSSQYIFNGTEWVMYLSNVTHANLLDASSATNHNRYLRNDADDTETGTVTFNPTGKTWPFELGITQTGRVARLNADRVDSKDVMDSALIPQADRIVVTDVQGNIHINKVDSDGVQVRDGVDYTELTTEILDTTATHYITLTDLTTRIIRTNAQRMFLGETEVLTLANMSTADVDMVDGKHASDFAPVNHTHIDEISFNDLSDVDTTGALDNYVPAYDQLNGMWRAKKFNEITTLAHSALAQLYTDDHTQYVHIQNARTISAQHTFTFDGQPFLVGTNSKQMVENLNANFLGGLTKDDFVQGDHTHEFAGLSDVITLNPQVGDIYVLNADGSLENKRPSDIMGSSVDALTVPTNTPHQDEILISDGDGGTYTAGIGVNQYNQLDMKQNGIKNAVIDCGAFYA